MAGVTDDTLAEVTETQPEVDITTTSAAEPSVASTISDSTVGFVPGWSAKLAETHLRAAVRGEQWVWGTNQPD